MKVSAAPKCNALFFWTGWAVGPELPKTIILHLCVPATDLGIVHKTSLPASAVSPKRVSKLRRPCCVWDYLSLVALSHESLQGTPDITRPRIILVKRLTLENCTSASDTRPDIPAPPCRTYFRQLTRSSRTYPTTIPGKRHWSACSRPPDRAAPRGRLRHSRSRKRRGSERTSCLKAHRDSNSMCLLKQDVLPTIGTPASAYVSIEKGFRRVRRITCSHNNLAIHNYKPFSTAYC